MKNTDQPAVTSPIDRRKFIQGTATAAAGLSLGLGTGCARGARQTAAAAGEAPAVIARGANDAIVMGLIGCGGRGVGVMEDFMKLPGVKVASLCDADSTRLGQTAAEVEKTQQGARPKEYKDYRQLLDAGGLDVVLVATPDHWHCLPVVHACEAGIDVYVEKPLAHNIVEGRAMANAAKLHGRVVQMGTQQRSAKHFQDACQIIQSGGIGQIAYVRCWNWDYEMPSGLGMGTDAVPEGVDYDLWLGPAPKRPFNSNRFHYQWRYFFDYAGGMLCDWGVHLLDIVHMAMKAKAPEWVTASGAKYALPDNRDTPDTLEVAYQFPATEERPGFLCTYANTKTCAAGMRSPGYGIEFYGEKASLFVDRSRYEIIPQMAGERENAKPLAEAKKVSGGTGNRPHIQNFLDCVKSRGTPVSDVETGHRSTTTPQLGNIAYLTGERLEWDAEKEEFKNSRAANRLRGRAYRKPWDKEARHLPLPWSMRRLLY